MAETFKAPSHSSLVGLIDEWNQWQYKCKGMPSMGHFEDDEG